MIPYLYSKQSIKHQIFRIMRVKLIINNDENNETIKFSCSHHLVITHALWYGKISWYYIIILLIKTSFDVIIPLVPALPRSNFSWTICVTRSSVVPCHIGNLSNNIAGLLISLLPTSILISSYIWCLVVFCILRICKRHVYCSVITYCTVVQWLCCYLVVIVICVMSFRV